MSPDGTRSSLRPFGRRGFDVGRWPSSLARMRRRKGPSGRGGSGRPADLLGGSFESMQRTRSARVKCVAEALGVSRATVFGLIERGEIPHVRLTRNGIRIRAADLAAFVCLVARGWELGPGVLAGGMALNFVARMSPGRERRGVAVRPIGEKSASRGRLRPGRLSMPS
jgi:excisionase family DNA binding protein